MILLPSDQILFKYDALYLLNEIHTSPLYSEISAAVSPQGLIALILSTPPNSSQINYILQSLEEYSPGLVPLIKDLDNLTAYFETISDEIDRVVTNFLLPLGIQTPGYFHTWQDLSVLVIHGSRNQHDNLALHQYARTKAQEQRYYDGNNAQFSRLGIPL